MSYLRYVIKNVEPLRIADDSTSKDGQSVTLRYIPGTSIRGVVINSIVKNHPSEFEKMKKILFSDKVKFLNAYLFENNKELIPSPKGFYEDKKTAKEYKEVENVVVKGDLTPGNKRAGLGRYCYFEGENIFCYDVETGSDMKIKIKDDSNIFRSEYIAVGHKFVGYISIDDESVKDTIEEVFKNDITIGNAKSQAMGRCIVEENNFIDDSNIPYSNYAVDKSVEKECYMMILSNTAMRNDLGEYVGIDLEKLKNLMNVSNLKIERCSTSVVNVKGYNRVWGTKIPSVNMYEIGSVFKLTFDGEFSIENAKSIMNAGLGIRKNEGFGRVLFLKDYENLKYKREGSKKTEKSFDDKKYSDDSATIKIAAKNYYRLLLKKAMEESIANKEWPLKIPSSQIGNVRAQLVANRYNPTEGVKILKDYFHHVDEKDENKKIHDGKSGRKEFSEEIFKILNKPISETLEFKCKSKVMSIQVNELMTDEEELKLKFDYIIELMKYQNRGGNK